MRHRRWFQQCMVAVVLATAALSFFLVDFIRFANAPVAKANQAFVYTLAPGTSLRRLSHDLYLLGATEHPNYFLILGKLMSISRQLQAGEYLIEGRSSPREILIQIRDGKVLQHSLTIIEGWTVFDLLQSIQANQAIRKTLDYNSPETLLAQLNINSVYPEGLFLPDTYYFPSGSSDREVLLRAYQAMQDTAMAAWQQRSRNLPYQTLYQALIAASLIEKETAVDAERPLVASVICNRLRKGMPLQIDPTVIYGLKDQYTGTLHKQDLKSQSVYNTYRHKGLPPTPIALPSKRSLEAALHPAQTEYYYFVAKGDGQHHFSKTLKEQNEAVNLYLKKRS